jgi:putative holliday junction resolvase
VNYLGIDYGEHRVGIAFADSELHWAFPRETIDQKTQNLMDRLEEIVKKEKIDIFVVGMPMHPDGRRDGKNRVVEQFITDLRQRFSWIPIETQDESYTSVVALQQTSYLSKKKKQKDKGIVDRAAATLILQAWLDKT